jgi:diguanylate cyclase (GGDEF)-like protein
MKLKSPLFSFCPGRRRDRLLHEIGAQIGAELDLHRLLRLIVERVRSALGYPYCAILIREGSDLVIRAVTEHPEAIIGKRISRGQGISGRCALSRKEMLVADLSRCDHYIHLGDSVFRSELDIPIVFHDSLLGVLNIQSRRRNAFSRRDIEFLRLLSHQIAVALHNSQVLTQMQLVQDIGLKLVSIAKPEALFALIVSDIRQRLHFDSCAILEVQDRHLVFKASSGEFPKELVGLKIPLGQGITGRCAREGMLVNVPDVRLDPGYIASGIPDIRSEIACPVTLDGELLGVLTVESRSEGAFGMDDVLLLTILSQQVAVGMRNARMYAEIEKLSVTDPLTGLYNQRYFYQRLGAEIARSRRYRHPLSVIMIDLDDFKKINDRCGHLFGDRVLREAALAIRGNIRRYDEPVILKNGEIDIVSRYGGEEFIVIQPDTDLEGSLVCAERLRRLLERRLGPKVGLPCAGDGPTRITGSFGVAAYRDGESLENLIQRVDAAMYRAKESGKNRVVTAGDAGKPVAASSAPARSRETGSARRY